jgi:hypothetical protein
MRYHKLICACLFLAAFCFFGSSAANAQAGDQKIILLRHSTGGNLYTEGNVAAWFDTYNSNNGTSYDISIRAYPTSPYPWNNYPYDYWNLWVNPSGPADASDPDIDTIEHLAEDYDVIIWKHCYPGSDILADTGSPDVSSSRKSLENYKLQYRALRAKFDSMPNSIFIVWTLAPRHRLATNVDNATRARQFVDWVRDDWLTEDSQSHPNIYIFDFWGNAAEESSSPVQGQTNTLKYAYERSHSGSDSHPNTLANQTIGPVFAQRIVDVIEDFHSGSNPNPTPTPTPSPTPTPTPSPTPTPEPTPTPTPTPEPKIPNPPKNLHTEDCD